MDTELKLVYGCADMTERAQRSGTALPEDGGFRFIASPSFLVSLMFLPRPTTPSEGDCRG